MPLESNATDDELTSPFYKANKELCEKWEEFILSRSGEINGKYGAWSFALKSKVKTNYTWLVDIKKSTYSNGSLFMSSKKQNLQEILSFKTKLSPDVSPNFILRERKKTDFLFGYTVLSENHKTYSLLGAHQEDKLISMLQPIIDIAAAADGSLRDIEFKDGVLSIVFAHKNDAFTLAERVLSFQLS